MDCLFLIELVLLALDCDCMLMMVLSSERMDSKCLYFINGYYCRSEKYVFIECLRVFKKSILQTYYIIMFINYLIIYFQFVDHYLV
jgi:hypothetical protein